MSEKIGCTANNLIRRNGKKFNIGDPIDCTAEEMQTLGGAVSPIHHSDDDQAETGDDRASNPVAPVGANNVALLGSSVFPELITIAAGDDVPLGDVVKEAFEQSGFTVEQWNALEDGVRDQLLGDVIESWRKEADDTLTDDERALRDRIRGIAHAIQKLDTNKKKLWNADGQPDLNALRKVAGDDSITDAERDAAWALLTSESKSEANAGGSE